MTTPHIAHDCPCIQKDHCPIWGNCEACVRAHRTHQRHVPECMQPMLRGLITDLAKKVEYGVVDELPTPEFWEARKAQQESK